MTQNNVASWKPDMVDDTDRIVCATCGETHALFQGSVEGMRIGEGVLFYKCGSRQFIGAINRLTSFGIKAWNIVR